MAFNPGLSAINKLKLIIIAILYSQYTNIWHSNEKPLKRPAKIDKNHGQSWTTNMFTENQNFDKKWKFRST